MTSPIEQKGRVFFRDTTETEWMGNWWATNPITIFLLPSETNEDLYQRENGVSSQMDILAILITYLSNANWKMRNWTLKLTIHLHFSLWLLLTYTAPTLLCK